MVGGPAAGAQIQMMKQPAILEQNPGPFRFREMVAVTALYPVVASIHMQYPAFRVGQTLRVRVEPGLARQCAGCAAQAVFKLPRQPPFTGQKRGQIGYRPSAHAVQFRLHVRGIERYV